MRPRRSEQELDELREQAARMRGEGIGGKRIAAALGISGSLASELLRGVPVPASVMRMRAKDEDRETAVAMRRQGRTYNEIKEELGVSKGSLSLWLRDLEFPTAEQRAAVPDAIELVQLSPDPDSEIARTLRREGWLLREIAEELGIALKTAFAWTKGVPVPTRAIHGRSAEETKAMGRAYWDAKLAEREVERQEVMGAAAEWVGQLTPRELELVAVTAYWCEGSKSKPWNRAERLTFINSDPDLIRVWLAWLRGNGIESDRLSFRVHIHESADVDAAVSFWSDVVSFPAERFMSTSLKRHNPRTVRKNTQDEYRGCLVVGVYRGRLLYQRMAGIWRGVVAGSLQADLGAGLRQTGP